ncbi:PRC-barrel domain-containing protein [Muricoccus radiodurans]|uniref:PRC-barrel domain-containing protein n=1 Tax=Muricoccus radiodurans TaxID=2231721 RepID=UPI003CFA5D10
MSDISPTGLPSTVRPESGRRLISGDKVQGTPVFNRQDERLGTIEDVMIDKITGRVAFAILSFGGFLGIGENHHPLPWSVLDYDTRLGGYVVDLTREQLEGAPTYAAADNIDLSDTYGRRVYDYYKAEPFWQDV